MKFLKWFALTGWLFPASAFCLVMWARDFHFKTRHDTLGKIIVTLDRGLVTVSNPATHEVFMTNFARAEQPIPKWKFEVAK